MAKKRNGKQKDLRTQQVFKQYQNGIKNRCPAFMVPNGVTNELMDVVLQGEVVGDAEIGNDGFIEIMFLVKGLGFIKLKREENKVHLLIV